MKSFNVTRKDGASGTISAASFVTDGSGTRFYDAEGGVIASFADGAIASVTDAAIVFVTRPVQDGTQDGDEA